MLPHLGLGGAQRVAASMAAYWVDRGHDVMAVTLLDHPPDFCLLHSRVERIMLPQPKGLLVRARRFVVRRIERHDASANRAPTGRSERPASEGRRLERRAGKVSRLTAAAARNTRICREKTAAGTIKSCVRAAPQALLLAGANVAWHILAHQS